MKSNVCVLQESSGIPEPNSPGQGRRNRDQKNEHKLLSHKLFNHPQGSGIFPGSAGKKVDFPWVSG